MSESRVIEDAITEARRLSSMSKEEKDLAGVYATSSDLSQLIKSLHAISNKSEKQSLSGLTRRVADFARRDSQLYLLIKEVVRTYGN